METNKTIYFAFINFSDDPEMIPPYTQYKELEAYCQNLGEEMFCWVEASSEFTPETAQSINYVLREHCELKDAEITMLVSDVEVLGSDIAVIREGLIHLRDIYKINFESINAEDKEYIHNKLSPETGCRRLVFLRPTKSGEEPLLYVYRLHDEDERCDNVLIQKKGHPADTVASLEDYRHVLMRAKPAKHHDLNIKACRSFSFSYPESAFNRNDIRIFVEYQEDENAHYGTSYEVWAMAGNTSVRGYLCKSAVNIYFTAPNIVNTIMMDLEQDKEFIDRLTKYIALVDRTNC